MALADLEVERVVRSALETQARNEQAIRSADQSVAQLAASITQSRRALEQVERRLRNAGISVDDD
jgi:phage shock protein A